MNNRFKHSIKLTITKANSMSYSKLLNAKRSYKRSTIKMTEKKRSIEIDIKAKDITALKATTNSLLNEVSLIDGISKIK